MNWYLEVLKKYAVFTGRATRSEYWYFVLFNMIISIVLGIVDGAAGTMVGTQGIIGGIYSLAVLVPSIAVGIRRMHDVGKSGWFILIPFYNLYLACQPSEAVDNQYGPDPFGDGSDDMTDHLVDNA